MSPRAAFKGLATSAARLLDEARSESPPATTVRRAMRCSGATGDGSCLSGFMRSRSIASRLLRVWRAVATPERPAAGAGYSVWRNAIRARLLSGEKSRPNSWPGKGRCLTPALSIYCWPLLAENHLTRQLFVAVVRRIAALLVATGRRNGFCGSTIDSGQVAEMESLAEERKRCTPDGY